MTPLEEKMAELAARFAARTSQERHALTEARKTGDMATLRDRAHKLAGIAAMFGQPAIGEAALELELAVESGGDIAGPVERLDALLAAL